MNYLLFVISIFLGFIFNLSITKKGSKINRNLPLIKVRFIQFCPSVKIHMRSRYIQIHHWLTYSIVLIVTLTLNAGVFDTLFSKGLLLGGILQGLTFSDWKTIIVKKTI